MAMTSRRGELLAQRADCLCRGACAPALAVGQLGELVDALADFRARQAQLVERLQVQPELRTGPEPMPESQGGIRRDAALAVDDPGDAIDRNVELARQLGG